MDRSAHHRWGNLKKWAKLAIFSQDFKKTTVIVGWLTWNRTTDISSSAGVSSTAIVADLYVSTSTTRARRDTGADGLRTIQAADSWASRSQTTETVLARVSRSTLTVHATTSGLVTVRAYWKSNNGLFILSACVRRTCDYVWGIGWDAFLTQPRRRCDARVSKLRLFAALDTHSYCSWCIEFSPCKILREWMHAFNARTSSINCPYLVVLRWFGYPALHPAAWEVMQGKSKTESGVTTVFIRKKGYTNFFNVLLLL